MHSLGPLASGGTDPLEAGSRDHAASCALAREVDKSKGHQKPNQHSRYEVSELSNYTQARWRHACYICTPDRRPDSRCEDGDAVKAPWPLYIAVKPMQLVLPLRAAGLNILLYRRWAQECDECRL